MLSPYMYRMYIFGRKDGGSKNGSWYRDLIILDKALIIDIIKCVIMVLKQGRN